MRMDILIVVNVPEDSNEQNHDFVDGVLKLFREIFPEAEQLPHIDINTPPAVTIMFPEEKGDRDVPIDS